MKTAAALCQRLGADLQLARALLLPSGSSLWLKEGPAERGPGSPAPTGP